MALITARQMETKKLAKRVKETGSLLVGLILLRILTIHHLQILYLP